MFLHTPLYLVFLLAVCLVFWFSPVRYRKGVLLAASYAFYIGFDWRFALLLAGITLANHFLGWAIPASAHPLRLAWLSVGINLGALALFKWANFFMDGLHKVFQAAGLAGLPAGIQILLPLGISFFSFQAISYTLQIYRKKAAPAPLLDLAVYMAFFPKLLAGPLVRPEQFLGQLGELRAGPDPLVLRPALALFLVGLVKKVVIADSLASLSDVAFRAAEQGGGFPGLLYWQGFYLYSFMIYADFSGYTDMARASAALLGFTLPENFKQPYLSENITTFWNRWHMSLTQWFREYLFYPLSRGLLGRLGRQHTRAIQSGVTWITMLLIGIWHGAAWTFVAWGAWHALLLSLNQQVTWQAQRAWQKYASGIITFHLVGAGWVLFRSSSFATAGRFFQGMLDFSAPQSWFFYLPPVLFTALLVFGIDLVQGGSLKIPARLQPAARPVLVTAAVVLLTCLALISLAHGGDLRPFIYGQF